ncbi:MAG: heme-copper oxidase subunit III [Verrucomicrobia bacterium]|nr:MAG: heme-copper oxidase subunit III [Verrucomicrobiota bacterium]
MTHAVLSEEIPYTVEARPDTGLFNAKLGIWLFLASEVMLFGAFFSSYIMLRVGATEWPSGLLSVPMGTFNTFLLASSTITVVMAWFSLRLGDFSKFKLYQGVTVLLAVAFLVVKGFEYRDKLTHYWVRLADGTELTGHIEGRPFNWSTATLHDPAFGLTEIVFHPDAGHAHAAKGEATEAAPVATHHSLKLPVSQIERLESFGPWHNTFLALYFTMTGLHVLHVMGGALVLAYFWGPGSRMWKTDPRRFVNRVEVSGLFWHFVDLVWIFLFPTLYLI